MLLMCSLILSCSGSVFLDKSPSAPARSDAHYDVLRRENEKLKAQLVLLQEEKNRIAKQVGA
jgi:cell division protein FtsB